MNESFDILSYLAGLTGYVFDTDVLTRIALDCGVAEVTAYADLTEEQKDRCKIALLETLLVTPYQSATQTDKHGEWQTQTGSQTLTAATMENIKAELRRLYKKYDEEEKLEQLDDIGANLEWVNEKDC